MKILRHSWRTVTLLFQRGINIQTLRKWTTHLTTRLDQGGFGGVYVGKLLETDGEEFNNELSCKHQ
jgi:hypothetical protein